MGQLIKLQDYVSRYEQDIYHYPTQYVYLKKQQWEKVNEALSAEVKQVLAYHKSVRHLRGGEATRKKWQQKHQIDPQIHMDKRAF
mgnify:CR=1 FL=1